MLYFHVTGSMKTNVVTRDGIVDTYWKVSGRCPEVVASGSEPYGNFSCIISHKMNSYNVKTIIDVVMNDICGVGYTMLQAAIPKIHFITWKDIVFLILTTSHVNPMWYRRYLIRVGIYRLDWYLMSISSQCLVIFVYLPSRFALL